MVALRLDPQKGDERGIVQGGWVVGIGGEASKLAPSSPYIKIYFKKVSQRKKKIIATPLRPVTQKRISNFLVTFSILESLMTRLNITIKTANKIAERIPLPTQ